MSKWISFSIIYKNQYRKNLFDTTLIQEGELSMSNTLKDMPVGSKGKVVSIVRESQFKRRLMDMGIIPGVEVMVTGKAPLGDPIEILVRGYNLTLRGKEALDIMVG